MQAAHDAGIPQCKQPWSRPNNLFTIELFYQFHYFILDIVPLVKSNIKKRSFSCGIIHPWNSLTSVLVTNPNTLNFKSHLKHIDLSKFFDSSLNSNYKSCLISCKYVQISLLSFTLQYFFLLMFACFDLRF